MSKKKKRLYFLKPEYSFQIHNLLSCFEFYGIFIISILTASKLDQRQLATKTHVRMQGWKQHRDVVITVDTDVPTGKLKWKRGKKKSYEDMTAVPETNLKCSQDS